MQLNGVALPATWLVPPKTSPPFRLTFPVHSIY